MGFSRLTYYKNIMSVTSRSVLVQLQLLLIHLYIYAAVQHTFAAKGPYVDWDYIGETSASIPCQRKVKDHVESDLNHFLRGKLHSSPKRKKT
jgi:hypothetical protein